VNWTISSSATVREDLRGHENTKENKKSDKFLQVVTEHADPEPQLEEWVGARFFLLGLGGLVEKLKFLLKARDQFLREFRLAVFS